MYNQEFVFGFIVGWVFVFIVIAIKLVCPGPDADMDVCSCLASPLWGINLCECLQILMPKIDIPQDGL